MSEADNVYDPLYGSFVGDQGASGARPRCASERGAEVAALALLLKHEFLDGGADDVTLATLGEVLLGPTLATLGNFLPTARAPWPASQWEAPAHWLGDSAAGADHPVPLRVREVGLVQAAGWGRPCLAIAKLHFAAFGGLIPGLTQQSAGTLDLYSMQIRASAFEKKSVSVTDPHGLGHAGRRATWAATSCSATT